GGVQVLGRGIRFQRPAIDAVAVRKNGHLTGIGNLAEVKIIQLAIGGLWIIPVQVKPPVQSITSGKTSDKSIRASPPRQRAAAPNRAVRRRGLGALQDRGLLRARTKPEFIHVALTVS